jgi:hypothetical protein
MTRHDREAFVVGVSLHEKARALIASATSPSTSSAVASSLFVQARTLLDRAKVSFSSCVDKCEWDVSASCGRE